MPEHSAQPHVFLSYCREDAAVMRRLRDDLRAYGLAVWSDESLDPGTTSWQATIERAIEGAGAFVIILSPDARLSRWMERELTYADARKVRLFPVLARGDERDAVPLRLINAQWTDIRTESGYAAGVRGLARAIAAHLGQEPIPSPLVEAPRPPGKTQPSFFARWWRVGACLLTVLAAIIFDYEGGGIGAFIGLLLMGVIGIDHLAGKRPLRGGLSLLAALFWGLYLAGAGAAISLMGFLGTLAVLIWEAVTVVRGAAA
jgi:hypothetical protein